MIEEKKRIQRDEDKERKRQKKKSTEQQWTLDCGLWKGWITRDRQNKTENRKNKEEEALLN